MIVSWNWLTEYVRLDMPVEELTTRLALAGLNHEHTSEVEGDLAIDLEVTSNRPDCLCHLGVAREIAVLFQKVLRVPAAQPPARGQRVEQSARVRVEAPDLCPRFTARVVKDVKIGESPWWLRKRLQTLGTRPINNIADITNYVMFECGQPLHAYDLDRLAGSAIVVRRGRAGEVLKAINGRAYPLEPAMLVIADEERPVGLAGVMGGLDTEISAATVNVLIEAAQFDAMSVKRAVRGLGLESEASRRFERPMDPEATEWASRRCAELILELAGGTLHEGVIDTGAPIPPRPAISLRLDQIPRVLGISIEPSVVERILPALGLVPVSGADGTLTYRPPSWRSDLEREIDLIEEVARVYGYEHIPEDRAVPLVSAPRGRRERVESEVRSHFAGLGVDEAATFSLVDDSLAIALHPGPALAPVRVESNRRKRENALRQSLVPSLLAARAHNEAHGNADAELFEIGNVYLPNPDAALPDEPARLGIVSGRDYLGLKALIEALLARLHIEADLCADPALVPLFKAGRAAELRLGSAHFGYLGEVELGQVESLSLRSPCAAAELSFDLLMEQANLVPQHRPLPPFPAITRDLSLVVRQSVTWAELAGTVELAAGPYLEALTYLDTFRGGNLPAGRQSVHFGLRFRHPERTFTGEEVDGMVKTVVEACAARFEATLRG
ncbi:MAG TPA: phenylalanine--tRNA ligase subunit beta [Isosphaeraceae bacterium]|nr:phenylalanine--tRNA ligase subunit beta [Isosphaeraceae bacterium]